MESYSGLVRLVLINQFPENPSSNLGSTSIFFAQSFVGNLLLDPLDFRRVVEGAVYSALG